MKRNIDQEFISQLLHQYRCLFPVYSDADLFQESHKVAKLELPWEYKKQLTSAILDEMKKRQELRGLKTIPMKIGA